MYILGVGHTVAKGTECDHGFVAAGAILELDLQDGDVIDDRSRDGGDEEEDGGGEQKESSNVVDNTGASHLE